MVGLTASAVFTGPAQGAPSQYSSYQQGQGQQYGSYRASQTGPSAQQQRPYGYEQVSYVDVWQGFLLRSWGMTGGTDWLPGQRSSVQPVCC